MPAAEGAWEKLAGALNLAGAAAGERRDAGDGAPRLSGIVESVGVNSGNDSGNAAGGNPHALLRVDVPGPGAVFASACPAGEKAWVTVGLYFYGDTAAEVVARDGAAWSAWMTGVFPG
jgi:hypothetical protein